MDVTRDQLLQQLSIMSSAMAVGGSDIPDINWDDLKDACQTLKRVEFCEMEIAGKYSSADILALFEKKIAGRRIFFHLDGRTNEALVILASPKDGGYFCARIISEKDSKGKARGATIQAARVYGFPDVTQLAKFAGNLAATFGGTVGLSALHR
jgi:hypothetical protein